MNDPMAWLERNKADIAAYEKARSERERMRAIMAAILTIVGIAIIAATLFG